MGFQQSYEHWNDGDSNPEHIFSKSIQYIFISKNIENYI